MFKAEHMGIEVGLEILGADNVVNPVNPPLDVAPYPFNIVGVGLPDAG